LQKNSSVIKLTRACKWEIGKHAASEWRVVATTLFSELRLRELTDQKEEDEQTMKKKVGLDCKPYISP
jgi:hypothetical protein